MVEYKVTGKNKMECAQDYVDNHIGEEIKFLNNGLITCGWDEAWIRPGVNKAKARKQKIWVGRDEYKFSYYSVNEIAKSMYLLSHEK